MLELNIQRGLDLFSQIRIHTYVCLTLFWTLFNQHDNATILTKGTHAVQSDVEHAVAKDWFWQEHANSLHDFC